MTTLINNFNYSACLYHQYTNSSNFFQGFYDHKLSNTFFVIFSIVGTFFLIPLLYGIIWYEQHGSDNKRTLLNKFVSSLCWVSIEYLLLCQIPDITRHIFGPMSQINCSIQMHLKLIVPIQILLILDGIIISRYFFIFWLKNPVAFNDNFWCFFLNIWIIGFSLSSTLIFFMALDNNSILYYVCIGKILNLEVLDQNSPLIAGPAFFNILVFSQQLPIL